MSKQKIVTQADGTATTVCEQKQRYFTTAKIAYIAMFVAINVVIGAISPRLGTIKLTLTYSVCFLAGYFFGGVAGGLVGGLGDLLGCLIGGQVPNPIILLASCLIGIIPGLVRLIYIKQLGKALPFFHIVLNYLLCFTICTLFINTYALWLIGLGKGATFWAYMGVRAASQTPIVAINLALTIVLYPIFLKIFKVLNKEKI